MSFFFKFIKRLLFYTPNVKCVVNFPKDKNLKLLLLNKEIKNFDILVEKAKNYHPLILADLQAILNNVQFDIIDFTTTLSYDDLTQSSLFI